MRPKPLMPTLIAMSRSCGRREEGKRAILAVRHPLSAPDPRSAMKPTPACLLAAFLLLLRTGRAGLERLGHRLVGELAERHLTPAARRRSRATAGRRTRPDPGRRRHLGRRPCATSDPARFKADLALALHQRRRAAAATSTPRATARTATAWSRAIEKQRAILADRSQPLAARRDALKFIVHFVGDVHQPMHAGNRTDTRRQRLPDQPAHRPAARGLREEATTSTA